MKTDRRSLRNNCNVISTIGNLYALVVNISLTGFYAYVHGNIDYRELYDVSIEYPKGNGLYIARVIRIDSEDVAANILSNRKDECILGAAFHFDYSNMSQSDKKLLFDFMEGRNV
jgi:hypothetical protein